MLLSVSVRVLLLTVVSLVCATAIGGDLRQMEVQSPVAVAPGERLLSPVSVDIKVASSGEVTALRPAPESPQEIVAALEKAIPRWTFEPATRDGVAVDWATRLTASLTAVPFGTGYALKVRAIDMRSVWYSSDRPMTIPRYPMRERRRHGGAEVLLLAQPREDGRGAEVVSALVDGKPARRSDPFAEAASEAVSRWPFEVLEWDGQRYASQACIPLNFRIDERANDRTEDHDGNTDEEQEEQCLQMEGTERFEDIHLLTKVVGTRL